MSTATNPKHIQYCRTNGDYDAYYDGQYIGSFATYHQAEVELDAHVLDLLERGLVDTTEGITTMQWQAAPDGPIARWREQGAAEQARIAALFCPDCGASWDLHWTTKPLVLARPGEVAELVYSARPVAPQTSAIEDMTQAPDAPASPQSDRPAVAPYRCPDCGDPVEAQEQQCRACREDAGVVDPTHCAHLEACDSSSCAACEPRWRGQTGRSMVGWLNDDLPAFLVFFGSLSPANKQETYQAIALVSENTPADVETFLSRSRARATALGML